ncbi:MAG: ABC transporter permease [candidate division Zixibacteria bacterium]|nr:ABC transporter permease [candidate division Zixibacteria bacterium]
MLLSPTEIRDAILMALSSVMANKFRSFLTILGVMVGVGSVISMASVIDGLRLAADAEIDMMGNNVIIVDRFGPNVDYDKLSEDERNRPWPTEEEAKVILEKCPTVANVAPQNHWRFPGGNVLKYKNRKFSNPTFNGTWPDLIEVRNTDMRKGRFFTQTDIQFRTSVCVIGIDIENVLFPNENSLGKRVRLNGKEFEVVGVYESAESNFGNDYWNRLISIPLSTYAKWLPYDKALTLEVAAASRQEMDQAKEEIISALRIHRKVPFGKPNTFYLSTQDQFKEQADSITDVIYIIMIVITSVGLLVGGIGVMNIMLVSVTERTREIGVRKAIGAKRSNIILQFLTEAMSLSGVGGVIGVVAGVTLGMILNSSFGFPVTLPVFWIVVGFGVSVSVGLISGVYPAIKAARLDPIEALRYE